MVIKPSKWQLGKLLRRTSYEVTPDEVIVKYGIVSTSTRRIPRNRITNVDLRLSHLSPGSSAVALNVSSGEPIVCDGLTKAAARTLAANFNPTSESAPETGGLPHGA